jgi:transcriptional regulator with XRE-family HTH domain
MKVINITASRIKELRIKRNFPQRHMAEVLNFESTKSYRNLENGEYDIKLSKLQICCDELKVPLHELLNFRKPIDDILMEQYILSKNPPPPVIIL